jgi:hypothetical protein
VLYSPYEMEVPPHCIHSVIEIRHRLTAELGGLPPNEGPAPHLRAMRAACRKFLDAVGEGKGRRPLRMDAASGSGGWIFNSALGELRGIVGIHIALMAARYGLDVEGDLAAVLPAEVDNREV